MIQSNSSHKARYFLYVIDTVSVKIHSVTNDGRTEEGLKQENIFFILSKQCLALGRSHLANSGAQHYH